MGTAISLDKVSRTYSVGWRRKPFVAVNEVSLEVTEGEVFGFIGPNGAGKSTTIKMLTGLLAPSAGQVAIFGKDAALPESRIGLGYVPENPSLPGYLTPLEILRMGMNLHGVKFAAPEKHARAWLERFDLAQVATKVVRNFSKGMVQRTALAHALALQPRLLILDEPLSGLDPIGRKDVVEILAEFRRAGGTIFLTSHVLHDVERLADRFGLIHQGQLRAVSSPAALAGAEEHVLVRSQGAATVAGMAQEQEERWVAEVTRAELWELLERMQAAGHSVIEIKPTLSLEAAFLSVVGAEK